MAARAQSMAESPTAGSSALIAEPAERAGGAPVAPPGRTAATSSRLLYDVIGAVYDWLGFDVVDDAVFRDLVIARIVEPTSKADAARVLADLGAETVSYRTIQRHLAKVNTGKYRDAIAAKCFAHAADCGGLSLLLYDVTTLYFEAENEDELRKVGYSQGTPRRPADRGRAAGRPHRVPVGDRLLRGQHRRDHHDRADHHQPSPNATTWTIRRWSWPPMPGCCRRSNLKALDEAGLGFIVGSRVTKAPVDLASHFHWNGDVFTDGQIIDTVTPRHGNTGVNNIAHASRTGLGPRRSIRVRGGRSGRTRPNEHGATRRPSHAQEDPRPGGRRRRTRQAKATRFVKVHGRDRTLDEASLARAQSLVGLKGYVTNIAVDRHGRGRGHRQVPRPLACRAVVPDVQDRPRARPMFHRTRDAIEAHLTIVFTALAVAHAIQDAHRPGHRQRRQATAPAAQRHHRHQRRHPDLPTRHPRAPTQNPGRPRHQTGVLSQMS